MTPSALRGLSTITKQSSPSAVLVYGFFCGRFGVVMWRFWSFTQQTLVTWLTCRCIVSSEPSVTPRSHVQYTTFSDVTANCSDNSLAAVFLQWRRNEIKLNQYCGGEARPERPKPEGLSWGGVLGRGLLGLWALSSLPTR